MTKPVQPSVLERESAATRYVGSRSVNWCGYNESGIRIAVVFPHLEGWAVAGRYENPWAAPHNRRHLVFTLTDAKADVEHRNPTIPLTWKSEEVEQAGHDFAPVEKAS